MILDAFAQFTGAVPATGIGNVDGTDSPTTGAQNSSNALDLHILGIPILVAGQGARDMGIGDDPALKISVLVTTAFVAGTSLAVTLQGAPDSGTGTEGTYVSWYTTAAAVPIASLVVGAQLFPMDVPRPPQGAPVPRFLRLGYTGAGTFTGGRIRGNIVLDRFDQMYNQSNNAVLGGYPAGIVIAN